MAGGVRRRIESEMYPGLKQEVGGCNEKMVEKIVEKS